MDTSLIARLAALDTCAVSDALDRAGLSGAALGLQALSVGRRISGQVITVELGPDDGNTKPRHLCTAAVDAAGPGNVIVIDHKGRTDVAGWGGILSKGATRNRVEGIIIDGACRDLDESRAFDLALYGRVAVPRTARGRIVERDWNIPISVAGISVSPNDFVIADGSGVVFVPRRQAAEIIASAERIAARERLMCEEVDQGRPMEVVMGKNYEEMLDKRERT
ncbi:MAG: hypothetical protein WDN08_22270 [Rhizomicrobium sp.]